MIPNEHERFIESILDTRRGRPAASAADPAQLDAAVARALEAVDLVWEASHGAPPLADDPVAAMLGLVPDIELVLDPRAVTAARKRAKLSVSDLASRLASRGWKVSAKDVFAWENGKSVDVPPAVVRAIAREVDVNPDLLQRRTSADPARERLRSMFTLPAFQQLAARWARVQGTTISLAKSALEARVLAAVHRGGAPEPALVLESLEALVSAVEQGKDG